MIAIIGGGITGLSAAFELTRRGSPCVLFEASDRLGGLVRTEHVDGFTIEAGADSMLAQKRAGVALCEALGLTSALISMRMPRTAFVWRDRRLHPLPPRSMLGIPSRWRDLASYALLPVAARARFALEPLRPAKSDTQDESIAAFFHRRFGAASVGLIAQPLLGGIHAGDVERLSLPALFPRLAEAERSDRKVLRWVRKTAAAARTGSAFQSLASGMGELVAAIERRLPAGVVRRKAPVVSLRRDGARWTVGAGGEPVRADAVILACPAVAARTLLADVDATAADLCAATRYVSTVSIALAWPRSAVGHPLSGSGFVVSRGADAPRITACTWVSSKWEGRAPPGQVLLRAYLGGAHDPSAVDLSDDELARIAVDEVSAILAISGEPSLVRVFRWRDAGAQHEVGHLARIGEIEARLATHAGLFVAGSAFRSIGIPDCIADGQRAAEAASRPQSPGTTE